MIKADGMDRTPMSSSTTALLFCLGVTILVPGCGTVEKERKSKGLEAAANGYGKAIRWGYYESAYGYVHPTHRVKPSADLGNVRVTSYQVVQPPILRNGASAEQVVHLEYVLADEQVVRRLTLRQDWRYDEQARTWWLHSAPPDFH